MTSRTATTVVERNPHELRAHHLATFFPGMRQKDFDAFKADIHAHGVREPIVLLNERILDGRHRARACAELGTLCPTRDHDEMSDGEPFDFVKSRNHSRRHESKGQRACTAALMYVDARRRAKMHGTAAPTAEAVADQQGCSRRSLFQAHGLNAVKGRWLGPDSDRRECFDAAHDGYINLGEANALLNIEDTDTRSRLLRGLQSSGEERDHARRSLCRARRAQRATARKEERRLEESVQEPLEGSLLEEADRVATVRDAIGEWRKPKGRRWKHPVTIDCTPELWAALQAIDALKDRTKSKLRRLIDLPDDYAAFLELENLRPRKGGRRPAYSLIREQEEDS